MTAGPRSSRAYIEQSFRSCLRPRPAGEIIGTHVIKTRLERSLDPFVTKGAFFDDFAMQTIGSPLETFEHSNVPICNAVRRHGHFHDQVVFAELMRPWRRAREFSKAILCIDIKDEYAVGIQVALRSPERPNPVVKFQQVIDRVIWAYHRVEGRV